MQSLNLSTHAPHSVHGFGSSRPCRRCLVMASVTPDQPSTSGRPADAPAAAPAAARGPAAAAGPGGRPRPSPRQMPPRMGPNGRPMMMGPDGQPVEMVAMEDRPDAFVGIAAVDRGENDNPSSAGRVALLASGDLAVLLAFAAVGRVNHGEPLTVGDTLTTALPFIIGWFTSGALLGGFGKEAQGGNTGAATVAAAKTWALGVPLGIAIRSVSRGYVPAASFIYVALGATSVLMIGWRAALAAVTPQADELTPAQAAAKRKDRTGGFMEGLQMIMSLTKRW